MTEPDANAADGLSDHLVQVLGLFLRTDNRRRPDGAFEAAPAVGCCEKAAFEQLLLLCAFAGVRVKQEDSASSKEQSGRGIAGPTRAPAPLKALSVRFPAAPMGAGGSGHSPAAALVFVLRVEAFRPGVVVSRRRCRSGSRAAQSAVQREV